MGMYKSPITIIESTIDAFSKTIIEQRENAIFAKIQDSFGVDLDKHELLRALQYDRDQYAKGYADGKADAMAELVRCKDCESWKEPWLEGQHLGRCMKGKTAMTKPDDFCSYGERRTDERKAD